MGDKEQEYFKGLDPEKYPEITHECGCKTLDGTVTDMCKPHEDHMNSLTQD